MSDTPRRVRLSRVKGARKPKDAVTVARPSVYGNPFRVDDDWTLWAGVALGYMGHRAGRTAAAVALHRTWLTGEPIRLGPLSGNTRGGAIEFTDGTVRSVGEQAQGIAGCIASLAPQPVLPERPDLTPLRGRDLACWCPLDGSPCHADTLLDLANAGAIDFEEGA